MRSASALPTPSIAYASAAPIFLIFSASALATSTVCVLKCQGKGSLQNSSYILQINSLIFSVSQQPWCLIKRTKLNMYTRVDLNKTYISHYRPSIFTINYFYENDESYI
jgi:hypothetical protein